MKASKTCRIALLLSIGLLAGHSAAQEEAEGSGGFSAEDFSKMLPGIEQNSRDPESEEAVLLPKVPCENITNPEVLNQCNVALASYYEYYEFGLEHRQRVIWWQHVSSRIILFIVLGLVLVGVFFAWIQFRVSLSSGAQPESNTVEVSGSGIKVSSPVLGVIILTLSLAFFYLYLVYVYPIVEII